MYSINFPSNLLTKGTFSLYKFKTKMEKSGEKPNINSRDNNLR